MTEEIKEIEALRAFLRATIRDTVPMPGDPAELLEKVLDRAIQCEIDLSTLTVDGDGQPLLHYVASCSSIDALKTTVRAIKDGSGMDGLAAALSKKYHGLTPWEKLSKCEHPSPYDAEKLAFLEVTIGRLPISREGGKPR